MALVTFLVFLSARLVARKTTSADLAKSGAGPSYSQDML